MHHTVSTCTPIHFLVSDSVPRGSKIDYKLHLMPLALIMINSFEVNRTEFQDKKGEKADKAQGSQQ